MRTSDNTCSGLVIQQPCQDSVRKKIESTKQSGKIVCALWELFDTGEGTIINTHNPLSLMAESLHRIRFPEEDF